MVSSNPALAMLGAGALVLSACGSDDYVIGRFADDSCASHADAILCSGFEKPDLSEWSRTIEVNAARVERTETRSFAGQAALHASSRADRSAAVAAKEFLPIDSGDLFLRVHVYVPSGLATETMNLLFLGDYATPDPFRGIDFNLESGALSLYSPESQPDRYTSTASSIPRDRWFCLQIAVAVSADQGTVQMRIDAEVALEQGGLNTRPAGGIHLLRAGVDWSSLQSAPFDVYMDNLVLATTPVACEP
ncbi:MAG TPA: hypothetical protein VK524_23055 [Polyangiaceae bacterium]|nr:hypothetical protein [Polyangiaceae bacterium]